MKNPVKKMRSLLIIVILSFPVLVKAQTPPDFEPQVYDVPFDGGVGFLVAVAIAYGLFKVWEKRKGQNA